MKSTLFLFPMPAHQKPTLIINCFKCKIPLTINREFYPKGTIHPETNKELKISLQCSNGTQVQFNEKQAHWLCHHCLPLYQQEQQLKTLELKLKQKQQSVKEIKKLKKDFEKKKIKNIYKKLDDIQFNKELQKEQEQQALNTY